MCVCAWCTYVYHVNAGIQENSWTGDYRSLWVAQCGCRAAARTACVLNLGAISPISCQLSSESQWEKESFETVLRCEGLESVLWRMMVINRILCIWTWPRTHYVVKDALERGVLLLHLHNARITVRCLVYRKLGIEPRASGMLGEHPTTWPSFHGSLAAEVHLLASWNPLGSSSAGISQSAHTAFVDSVIAWPCCWLQAALAPCPLPLHPSGMPYWPRQVFPRP